MLKGHFPASWNLYTPCELEGSKSKCKHESEARVLIWRRTRFVWGRLITKILHLSERVTHLHIAVPTKTRFYPSGIHVLKIMNKLLLTVLEIEDYYVDTHSVILNLNTSNYYTL